MGDNFVFQQTANRARTPVQLLQLKTRELWLPTARA